MCKEKNSVTIIYASQTGQAQAIAESIFDDAISSDLNASIFNISDHEKKFKFNEITDPVIFVCSTTGDGEVPETAVRTYNRLRMRNQEGPSLKSLNYALLGLGDTNYTSFCNGPKSFEKVFSDQGANCFYGPFWADDGTGLDLVVEPFKEGLWNALESFMFKRKNKPLEESDEFQKKIKDLALTNIELTIPVLSERIVNVEVLESSVDVTKVSNKCVHFFMDLYSSTEIYEASIVSNTIMTSESAVKTCHNLKFVPEKLIKVHENNLNSVEPEFSYEPGDAINVLCPNNFNEVEALLKRLNVIEQANNHIKLSSNSPKKLAGQKFVQLTSSHELSFRNFFTYCVDIRAGSVKKVLIRTLANYCTDETDEKRLLELCSKEGSEQFETNIKGAHLSLLDLLEMFKSCQPPIDHLIQSLSPLVLRSYSLCSVSNELEIVFNLVCFDKTMGRNYVRKGIATGHLSSLQAKQKLYFFKRKFQTFTFPTDEELGQRALLMFGPGTGVAPFISYLRSKLEPKDKNLWLFYGCRDPEKDFLFKSEIVSYSTHGPLKKCFISLSRVESSEDADLKFIYQAGNKYVQDSIRYNAKEISQLIYEQEACVYVCGDGAKMSKNLLQCLAECISQQYNLSSDDANNYLLDMLKSKRYKQDIWA